MAGSLDEAFVEITAELDTRQAQREASKAGRVVENELTSGVRRAEQSMAREAAKIGETVGNTIAANAGESLGDGLRRNAAGRLVDSRGKFVSAAKAEGLVIGDTLGESIGDGLANGLRRRADGRLIDAMGRFVKEADSGGSRSASAFGNKFTSGLRDALSSIVDIKLPVPAFATLGLGLAAAAASAVQLTAALAPAVGIIATLPSGIGVLAAGMTTLNVATMGVGDAFEAAFGDAEEFEEAMEGLAPNVQAAAQALRDMAPELDALRDRVQQAFFQDFDDILNQLADTLLGPVSNGMTTVASGVNDLLHSLTAVATSQEGVDFVSQSFAIMAGVIERLQEPLTLLFSSLLSVGSAINEAFGENAGAGLANLITQFALFLEQAAASGQAVAWIEGAMKVFSSLGEVLGSLVGIIGSIGSAASATGGNILGVFGQALAVFDSFLASAQGQSALISIFQALNTVGDAFATVLSAIAPAIPPIVSGISSILSAVAPLLGPLATLVGSVLSALAPVLGVIAAAIQPLIGPLTAIIEMIGPILIDAITSLMPFIEILAELLGGALGVAIKIVGEVLEALAPILTTIFDALGPLLDALQPLFDIFALIADLLGTILEPIITVLGDILLWLVDNVIIPLVIPAIELLADILTSLLGDAVKWLLEQFRLAGIGIEIVFNFLKDVIGERVDEMIVGFNILKDGFKAAWDHINRNVFTPLKNGFNIVKNSAIDRINEIKSGFNIFVDAIVAIPGKVRGALSSMFDPLWTGFKGAINNVISGWNSLSFSLPSVDLGPLGSTPGVTVSTPNIPYLARGALATGPTLAMVGEAGTEAILPLEDPRVTELLASALSRAGAQNAATGGSSQPVTAAGESGDIHVLVKIGDRELTDIVVEKQNQMNQQMLRRARSGTRRNH